MLKLNISGPDANVKIEVTPVLRGSVFGAQKRAVTASVENRFGYVEVPLLSFNDLYAGKICAALDRQHPRDLYDTLLLLNNEGINRDLMRAFMVYLIGHNRPMAELLAPKAKPLAEAYESEFSGMTYDEVKLNVLEQSLPRLVATLMSHLNDDDKTFLLAFKAGQPDWNYLELAHFEQLPSIRWKLLNIEKMHQKKRTDALAKLETVLFGGKVT